MSADEWLATYPGVRANEPLARHSQFGVGGPAQWFTTTRDTASLATLLRLCSESGVPVTMLGAGSNTLISDAGIQGLVIRHDDRTLHVEDEHTVRLGGGCMMPRVALDCAKRGLAGLEFGIGVPGTCGASVYGNAGAFGTEMADVLIDCAALDLGGRTVRLTVAECGFSYRHSRFKDDLSDHVVVSARLRVHPDDPALVRERTDAVQAQRKASQPYGVRSLGSVFKNPPDDKAGRLVEAAGMKGRRSGGAQISPKHANFIVNVDHASAADVLTLVAAAHDAVQQQFGVDLEREIILIGTPGQEVAGG
ncbi:MAG: UDP-N-acetylmuramate dehydrogenase [Candidatus Dormiibacterota bacterium]